MLGKLMMVVLPLLAALGGAAGGAYLGRPPVQDAINASDTGANDGHTAKGGAETARVESHQDNKAGGHGSTTGQDAGLYWFKFPQQFFVPLVRDGTLNATMVLSLSLEVPAETVEEINAKEFKLRDILLRQLLIQANTGGFDGNFTADARVQALRTDLLTAVQGVDSRVEAVLIGDITREQ